MSTGMGGPRSGTWGELEAVRAVAGKVCPGLRARWGNPPVLRPFSDLYVFASRNNAPREKLGPGPEGKRGATQESIPSGQRYSLRRSPFLLNILLPPNFLPSVTSVIHAKGGCWISNLIS